MDVFTMVLNTAMPISAPGINSLQNIFFQLKGTMCQKYIVPKKIIS